MWAFAFACAVDDEDMSHLLLDIITLGQRPGIKWDNDLRLTRELVLLLDLARGGYFQHGRVQGLMALGFWAFAVGDLV